MACNDVRVHVSDGVQSGAALLVVTSSIGLGTRTPTAFADDWCPDVELVFARGTGEPPGMGRVCDALAARLQPILGGRPGDPICSDGRNRSAHSNYDAPPYIDQATGFVAGLGWLITVRERSGRRRCRTQP